MPIRGRIETTYDLDSGEELLGDVLVPRKLRVTLAGELGEPDVAIHFEVRDGRPECVDFIATAKPNGRGLRTSDLALINVDAVAERAFLEFSTDSGGGELGGKDERETWRLRKGIGEAINAPGRGPTRAELEEVARIYRAHPKAPTSAVTKLMRMSRRTAARRVQQAREAGIL